MLKHIFFILIIVGGAYYYWSTRTITHGPGVVAPTEPNQKEAFGLQSFEYKNSKIIPKVVFEMEARVLSKQKYSDKYSQILPYDFVMGWGPMSDERNLNEILIKQSERYFDWEMINRPIPRVEMVRNSANLHIGTSDQQILDKLYDVRKGHVIRIKGYLVDVKSADGWNLKTSLKRDDYGKDGSEVVWIQELSIL